MKYQVLPVNISAKTEYACLAVMELAARYDDPHPTRLNDIAQRHGIPNGFLVQILIQLKSAGIVSSVRGKSGGYRLVQDPATVSLGSVMSAVDGSTGEVIQNSETTTPFGDVLNSNWNSISQNLSLQLAEITIAQLIQESRDLGETMYYI